MTTTTMNTQRSAMSVFLRTVSLVLISMFVNGASQARAQDSGSDSIDS